jgi:nitrogen-specific signal transduction histidine kinase/ActR/RegA family two-component response regulator
VTERKQIEHERAHAQEQRRAREEAEAANRAKDEFLAALSHELRTPLTPILSIATAMEDEDGLPWPCQDAMKIVRRNIELEARLIDDLLDLTRIIRGKLHLRCQVVDVHRLLQEVLEICDDDLRGKGLNVVTEFNATEFAVEADKARLEQVFWNLVKNAVKFTSGGGTIWVSTRNSDDGKRIHACVRDTGVGIDPDVMDKIFQAFQQGGDAVTRRYGGLGLGLAIGKGIVEAHHGRITAESRGRGQGASFEVELATVPGGAEQAARPQRKRSERKVRILLVEDHPDTARVMTTLLRGLGHEVERATSVRAAIGAARSKPFEVMISDLGLPDGNGWDLMREVRRIRPEILGIALSGYGMEHDLRRSKEAGFEHHVVKPFNFARLTHLIQEMVGNEEPDGDGVDGDGGGEGI